MSTKRLPPTLVLAFLLLAVLGAGIAVTAQSPSRAMEGELPTSILQRERLAKAQPDECFNGIGLPYSGTVPACESGMPKVNQSYVWGLAKAGDDLWFGTGPNIHCLVFSGFLGITTPIQTASYVCEFGESQYSPPLPPAGGDWRPPDLFRYDTEGGTLTEVTPVDPRVNLTSGIRSAGAHDGVVLLGGPGLLGGINLFAFDAQTDAYLGSTTLLAYSNIRKWLVVEGVLYAGVRSALDGGGRVLRWTGNVAKPFQFEVVGTLGSEPAELALHEGRLFVSTWPNLTADPIESASLYMSPPIPPDGLTGADAGGWQRVWQAEDYEPDPVTAATYGGGALHSFDGHLYWGTMHVPFRPAFAHFSVYGTPANAAEAVVSILNSHRAISIFRGQGFGTPDQEIELLYGSRLLFSYLPQIGLWAPVPNNMGSGGLGMAPLWGPAGFDNYYNNYTWTMDEYAGQLYVGTMDDSYLIEEGLPLILAALGLPPDTPIPMPEATHGADLYRFPSAASPALAESLNGVGNPSTYGVRTMLADDALYLGMANPMNLLTDPLDDKPEGGWELLRLTAPEPWRVYLPLVAR